MARVVIKPGRAEKFAVERATILVRRASGVMRTQAKRNAPGGPYSTGTLKNSIHVEGPDVKGESVVAFVGSDLIYANSVHGGQPARTIVPVRASKLVFFWRKAGRVVVRDSVNHPGTTAQPYLTSAMRTVAPRYGFKTVTYRN